MRIRAVENFSGSISMSKGEERELDNELLLMDLLKAGYIEEAETAKVAPVQPKKRGAKDENKPGNG